VSPTPDPGGSDGQDGQGGAGAVDHGSGPPGTVRWALTLAYDGSGYHGFAAQTGQRTVAGTLIEALGRVTRTEVSLTCAGRTDAGVHALDQVVHLDLPAEIAGRLDPDALVKSCNSQLGPSIVVRQAGPAARGFDARHSATARRYRYLVVNAPVADPLLAGLTWQVADPLDLRSMAAAADALLGEHDFRAFCRRVPGTSPDEPIHRRVLDARWTRLAGDDRDRDALDHRGDGPNGPGAQLAPVAGDLLAFEIEATAFCHQMVRSLVGTLVDVGRGRKRASDILWILRSADRQQASQPAPPQGLTLMAVRYPGDRLAQGPSFALT
jgi:tRNA pseudouridine38-40 synthase